DPNQNIPMVMACAHPSISCIDGQGTCRAVCEPGEVSIGKCDGLTCSCCGNAQPILITTAPNQNIPMVMACTHPSISCNDGQGTCRAVCEPGEVSFGKCDGHACSCCGNAHPILITT
ncbi:unnamed protein product, partial [Meganyctiphanes norvegica]